MSEISTPELAPEQRAEVLLGDYLNQVGELGIVSGILVGTQVGKRGGKLWNVLTEDFTFKDKTPESMDPFHQLNQLGYSLKMNMKDILHLDIAHINPSQLTELKKDCDQNGIDIDLVPIELRQQEAI